MLHKQKKLHGSPRLHADLRADGWKISGKTRQVDVTQGLVARQTRGRGEYTRRDRSVPLFPDLLCRDCSAQAPNLRWDGDFTEIPTGEGKL